MAKEARHAAWRNDNRFAVTLLPGHGPAEILVSGLAEFLDAVDFVAEWLKREEAGRAAGARLAILKTANGRTDKVWAYPPEPAVDGQHLLKTFGFDPLTWGAARPDTSLQRTGTGPADGLAAALGRPTHVLAAGSTASARSAAPARTQSGSSRAAARAETGSSETTRATQPHTARAHAWWQSCRPDPWIGAKLQAAWHDRISRWFLVLGLASVWLSFALADARCLVLVLMALIGLWWRRGSRSAAAAIELEEDGWL